MRTPKAALLWLLFLIPAATNACEKWAAMIVSVNGAVMVDSDQTKATAIQPEAYVCPGQRLVVGVNSRAAIYLSNNSFVRLDENTILSFPAVAPDQSKSYWVELKQGVSHFISRLTQRFEVKTPYTNAAVDGTEFLVASDSSSSTVSVIEGQVSVSQPGNPSTQALTDGQSAVVSAGSQIRILPISATDTVDWAVYFPPLAILSQLHSDQYANEISQAAQHIQKNRADLAIKLLESLQVQDSAVQVALASAYVSVGKLEPAKQALNGLEGAEALALGSLIATLTNQPQQALQLALTANSANDQSLAAHLALTYAYQANLDLNAALKSARDAAERFPEEFSVWARLSELQVATGDVGGADKAIQAALQLNDHDSSVLVQSGFIYLFNHSFKKAETQFTSAIQLDSENPQARLGLGLTLLRQGELEDGRKQLEFAVSLDPARSVLRSYLGRAYFEEHRDEEASVQWGLAKQMDPQDPTAYFYEGVRKLYANNPIGAIEELETSRKLNDERALYRSETLLQSDAASRSAALARAYDDVGYDRGVELTGWESLRRDPTNSEGHRLMADTYRGDSRSDSARASELLQSQLWQPLSAYPVQPQLGETGISLIEGSGPQQPGYNEYHSLFVHDGIYGAATGYGGSDGTWGDDVVGSFIAGPVTLGLSQYHFETDGWHQDSAQQQDIYSAYVQWQIDSDTSVQLESRSLDWSHGDIYKLRNDLTINDYSRELSRETNRFGLKTRLKKDSYFLLSLIDQNETEKTNSDSIDGFEVFTDLDSDPAAAEIQIVRIIDDGSLIVGAGYREIEQFGKINGLFFGFDFFNTITEKKYSEFELYTYVSKMLNKWVGVDLGVQMVRGNELNTTKTSLLGADSSFDTELDIDVLLPKLGINVNVAEDWVLRLAAFDTLQRGSPSLQSIAPTTFLGFDQVYSMLDYSESKNKIVSLDGRINSNSHFGVEFFDRQNNRPYIGEVGEKYTISGSEKGGSFIYKVDVSDSFILSAKYIYAKVDEDNISGADSQLVGLKDEKIPLLFKYYMKDGFEVSLSVVHYIQDETTQYFDGVDESVAIESREATIVGVSLGKEFECRCANARLGVDNLEGVEDKFSAWNSESYLFYPNRFYYGSISFNF